MRTGRTAVTAIGVAALAFAAGRWLPVTAGDQWLTSRLPPSAPDSGQVLMVGFDKPYVEDPASRPGLTDHLRAVQALDRLDARVIVLADGLNASLTPGRAQEFADAIERAGNVIADGSEDRGFLQAAWFVATVGSSTDGELDVVTEINGVMYPSASLAAVLLAQDLEPRVRISRKIVHVGPHSVPIERVPRESGGDDSGYFYQTRIAYAPSLVDHHASSYASAADLLNGKLARKRVAGRIVVLAASKAAEYRFYAGVWSGSGPEETANAINTMLTDFYIRPASGIVGGGLASLLALVGLSAATRRRLWWGPVAAVATSGAYAAAVYGAWLQGLVLPAVTPLTLLWLVTLAALGVRLALLGRQRRRTADALSRYVPAPVARDLMRANRRGGRASRLVTFLFTDVVDSTRAWNLAPAEMEASLHRHDEIVADVVAAHGGYQVLPRSEGDSRFVVFSDPVAGARAALELHRRLGEETWPIPNPLRVRAALHTDQIDAQQAVYYGTPVNRCTAIRGLAGAGQTFISEGTAEFLQAEVGIGLLDRGELELPGATGGVHVYELVSIEDHASISSV